MTAAAAFFAAHKALVLGGGAAGAAGLYMARRKAAAAGPVPTLGAGTNTAAPVGAATYNSTAQDVYSSLEPQLATLQGEISALGTTAPSSSPLAATATSALDAAYGPGAAVKYGTAAWAQDSGYARSLGVTPGAAPADLGSYGQQRYDQNLYAAANAYNPAAAGTAVPGGNFTVGQSLHEQQWANAHGLGGADFQKLGATV